MANCISIKRIHDLIESFLSNCKHKTLRISTQTTAVRAELNGVFLSVSVHVRAWYTKLLYCISRLVTYWSSCCVFWVCDIVVKQNVNNNKIRTVFDWKQREVFGCRMLRAVNVRNLFDVFHVRALYAPKMYIIFIRKSLLHISTLLGRNM
jgi:hypothetical protein